MGLLKNEARNATLLVIGNSTGNDQAEWVYKLAQKLSVDWPRWTVSYRLWDDVAVGCAAAVTAQTGTGSRTLTVHDTSVAGASTLDWVGGVHYAAATAGIVPEVVVISLGHNEGSSYVEPGWFSRYLSLTETRVDTVGSKHRMRGSEPGDRELTAHRGF